MDANGSPMAPSFLDVTSLCGEKPDLCLDALCQPKPEGCLDNPDFIRDRIRLSGPNHPDAVYHVPEGSTLAGTVMPFWAKDKLSDNDVEDLTAYILAVRQSVRDGSLLTCTNSPDPGGNILRSGDLEGLSHGLAGREEELDTRRIRFTNFSYDGGGIQVRVWLYKGDDVRGGRAIGRDIFGQVLTDSTFVVELPADIAPESFDHVSIRCVSGRQDLAHAALK